MLPYLNNIKFNITKVQEGFLNCKHMVHNVCIFCSKYKILKLYFIFFDGPFFYYADKIVDKQINHLVGILCGGQQQILQQLEPYSTVK